MERPKPYKPKTIKVNVTKENSEVWLNQRPEYSEGCKFIEILREAVEKNLGSFEVPQNYPAMDEYARLIFVTEKELKRRRLDFNFYACEDFGKKNGVVIADKYYFVLYVVSIMNKYLEKSEETAENIFDAICATDGDERGKYEDVMRIREELSGEISFDISRMVASTGDNWTSVSLPFCIDEDFLNKADNGDDNSVAFYIIAS